MCRKDEGIGLFLCHFYDNGETLNATYSHVIIFTPKTLAPRSSSSMKNEIGLICDKNHSSWKTDGINNTKIHDESEIHTYIILDEFFFISKHAFFYDVIRSKSACAADMWYEQIKFAIS